MTCHRKTNGMRHVCIQNGHAESIRLTGKISKTIWGYLEQLIEAIRQEQNISDEEERIAS